MHEIAASGLVETQGQQVRFIFKRPYVLQGELDSAVLTEGSESTYVLLDFLQLGVQFIALTDLASGSLSQRSLASADRACDFICSITDRYSSLPRLSCCRPELGKAACLMMLLIFLQGLHARTAALGISEQQKLSNYSAQALHPQP